MFPRYLFISLDTSNDNWAPIRSTFGVTRLVRFGPEPAVVPDALIQLLMDRENDEGLLAPPRRSFEKGDRVRIFEGPFKDYEAIFPASNSNERVVVLLEILGKESRVAIDPAYRPSADERGRVDLPRRPRGRRGVVRGTTCIQSATGAARGACRIPFMTNS
ncbi:MAG: hypothetical protein M5U09_26195 [Gammaproteobacteria bacterium]|nr:hypothetical protein [Gammaproteobacteria bacterium]